MSTKGLDSSESRAAAPAAAPSVSAQAYQHMDVARPASRGPEPPQIAFSHDIYGSPQTVQQVMKQLQGTDAAKISFTTPGQDASTHSQPDYYLNAEGKLVKNPNAHPNPDGKISIEVEGNNSARKAEQYANQMQKEAVKDLIAMYRAEHGPNAKIPEDWLSIMNSTPDSNYPNTGDSQNNTTVTQAEGQAYDQGTPAAPSPSDNPNPPTVPQGQPGEGAPSGGASQGSGGASSDTGGAPSGGDWSGGSGPGSNIPNQVTGDGGASTGNLPQSSGTMANYDGNQADMSATQQKIIAEADKDIGQSLWGGWSGASAVEGCAASVSQVLDNAGAANLHNAQDDNVNGLQADLMAQGWTLTSTPQPGDVWIGRGGASSGHTGIVGLNDTLINNNSFDASGHPLGKWLSDSGSMTGQWTQSVFLKPPDATKA